MNKSYLKFEIFSFLSGSFAYKDKINQKAIFVDPVGAIVISLYIIYTWIKQANGLLKIFIS